MRYKFAYIKIIHVLKFQVRDKSAFRHSLEYEFHIIIKKWILNIPYFTNRHLNESMDTIWKLSATTERFIRGHGHGNYYLPQRFRRINNPRKITWDIWERRREESHMPCRINAKYSRTAMRCNSCD